MIRSSSYTKKLIFFLIVFFGVLGLAKISWAADKYVNKSCSSGCDGTTWAKGWSELNQVTGLVAGDTLWISGGVSGQTYTTTLTLDGNNATSGNRIYIRPGAAHPTLSSGHDGLVTITAASGVGIAMFRNYYTLDGSANQTDGGTKRIKFRGGLSNAVYAGGKGVIVKNCYFYQNTISDSGNSAANVTIRGVWSDTGTTESFLGEISYNYIDDPFYMGIWTLGPTDRNVYGLILVHHNEVVNFGGEDAIRADGRTDVYDNLVHGRIAVHSPGYHPDGIVTMSSYVRIFRNKVYDFAAPVGMDGYTNAFIYLNPYSNSSVSQCCVKIYNNLIYQEATGKSDDYPRGIECSWQGTGPWTSISDIYIVNNTLSNLKFTGLSFYPRTSAGNLTNIKIMNNLFTNSGQDGVLVSFNAGESPNYVYTTGNADNSPAIMFDYNIMYPGASGTNYANYKLDGNYTYANFKAHNSGDLLLPNKNTDGTEINNPNLSASYAHTSSSTNVIGKGKELSSLTNMDAGWPNDLAGVTRPQGSAWDIGAYEYVGGAPPDTTPPSPPQNVNVS